MVASDRSGRGEIILVTVIASRSNFIGNGSDTGIGILAVFATALNKLTMRSFQRRVFEILYLNDCCSANIGVSTLQRVVSPSASFEIEDYVDNGEAQLQPACAVDTSHQKVKRDAGQKVQPLYRSCLQWIIGQCRKEVYSVRHNISCFGLASVLIFAVAANCAASEKAPMTAPSGTADTPTPQAGGDGSGTTKPRDASEPAVVEVKGFRSALFGMDENEVRAAIAKDFGKTLKLRSTANAAERTHGLVARVSDALPDGGASDISYVMGYKTKKLIQVSIVWSKSTDPSLTPEKLVSDADVLKANFSEQGYKADTIVSDVAVRGGVLMFRGSDASGRTTALMLEGRTLADKDRKIFEPASLLLIYMADPKHADVFRLAPGQF